MLRQVLYYYSLHDCTSLDLSCMSGDPSKFHVVLDQLAGGDHYINRPFLDGLSDFCNAKVGSRNPLAL